LLPFDRRFSLAIWATFYFYERHMKVIRLEPQKKLITSGPYSFSRNPLYLGGNLFIFLGAVLFLGSPSGVVLTAINILVVDIMIRREEKQLERDFGEEWVRYRSRVRRWLSKTRFYKKFERGLKIRRDRDTSKRGEKPQGCLWG
jgi:protein-S-isoprenylcysteine O-methyltransferase Ste14